MTYRYSCSNTKFWHMGRSLLSSPFFISTSVAFLFWFLLWFACILAFSFELSVDCFVRRLFPLLCLPFAVVYLFLPRFQYRNWNFMNRIAVRGLQFLLIKKPIYHRKSVISNEIVESSSQSGQPFKRKPFSFLQNRFGWWNAPPRGTPLFLDSAE